MQQASAALQQLRLALGLKSALFIHQVRGANSQRIKTRAYRSVKTVEDTVRQHAQEYRIARQGLIRLSVSPTVLAKFPSLEKGDCKMSRDIVEENRVGQRNEHVSWIWRIECGANGDQSAWEEESGWYLVKVPVSFDKNTPQSSVSIGYVARPDISDGKKRSQFSKMRWFGQSCGLNIKCSSGKREEGWLSCH